MRASIAVQIEPNCQDDYEAVRIVDEVIDYIRSTGLHYYVGPSETSIEGDDLHQLIDILENCMQVAAKAGSAQGVRLLQAGVQAPRGRADHR